MKTINQLVAEIKENEQDFEFYPTTEEIVRALKVHVKIFTREDYYHNEVKSILDIGCGNGAFFEKYCNDDNEDFKNVKKYGIEKSIILAEQLPEDVILLGADFNNQNLIDKKVDMIFCNPPYSQYDTWAEKIILQGNCKVIALVIPSRWKDNDRIKLALERRNYEAEVAGSYDFMNAERKARANVDLVFITPKKYEKYRRNVIDPFEIWFDDTFKINATESKDYESVEKRQEKITNELVKTGDTAEMLVELYNNDMQKLYSNYKALEELDAAIFKELQIDVPKLKESLKTRLQGLKSVYWDLLFKKYDKITTRLTSAGKKKVTQRLNDNTYIDFNMENIYQLTLWIIRHSNTLFDEQITDYFFSLCNTESIHRYKSNKRWNDDDWKYLKNKITGWGGSTDFKEVKKLTNIILDYRIVVRGYANFTTGWCNSRTSRLTESAIDFLGDTKVIGQNLGFDVEAWHIPGIYEDIVEDEWKNFNVMTKDGKVFANIKLYQNGNRHVKFCKEFMQKLNIEMARINGWIRDKGEAMQEMDIPADVINQMWGTNLQIGLESGKKLLGLPE